MAIQWKESLVTGVEEIDNQHKEQHKNFINDFLELKKQIDAEGANARSVILINRVVVDWLIKHIGVSDKKLGAFLKDKI